MPAPLCELSVSAENSRGLIASHTYTRCLDAISRMSSRCILRFSPDEVQILVVKGIDAVETWA